MKLSLIIEVTRGELANDSSITWVSVYLRQVASTCKNQVKKSASKNQPKVTQKNWVIEVNHIQLAGWNRQKIYHAANLITWR